MNESGSPGGGERPTDEKPAAVDDVGAGASVAEGSALLSAARVSGNAGFFVAVLVLTRVLSEPHRGQFAFVTTAAQILALVASIGVTQATVVLVARHSESRGPLLSNVLLFNGVSALITSAVFAGALVLTDQAGAHGLAGWGLVLLGIGTVASALANAGNAFLSGCRRWRSQALASAATPWLYALLLVVASTQTPLTVDLSFALWDVYYIVWAAILVAAAVRLQPLGRPSGTLLRGSLGFGVRAWAGSVTQLLNYRADQLLMGFITTQAALAVYVVAVNASEILLILPGAAATALLPVLARSRGESRTERTLRLFRIMMVTTLIAMAISAAVGPTLIPAVFGARYQSSVTPFLWLVAGTLGFVASSVFAQALFAISAPGLTSIAQIASLVVDIGLDLVLIPRLGPTGAAIGATAAFYTGGMVTLTGYRRRAPFSYRLLVPERGDLHTARTAVATLTRLLTRRRPGAAPQGSRPG
jgi:O-antigen/teichoic acid export membrane protein